MPIQTVNKHKNSRDDLTFDVQHAQHRRHWSLKWTPRRYRTCHHCQKIEQKSRDNCGNDHPSDAGLLVPHVGAERDFKEKKGYLKQDGK